MWILSVDTALRNGNIALGYNGTVKQELVLDDDMKHSSRVLEAVNCLFAVAALTLNDLNGLAVTVGPGSFTGLRIGMSTVKGLAFALNIPVAGICVLEALAYQADFTSGLPIMAVIDGSKQEVFTRSYRFTDGGLAPVNKYANLGYQAAAEAITEKTVLIGNGVPLIEPFLTVAGRQLVRISPLDTWMPVNQTLVRLAYLKFVAGKAMDGGLVMPNYIRKSDAEIDFDKKC